MLTITGIDMSLSLDLADALNFFDFDLGLLPDPDPVLRKLEVDTRVFDAIRADPDVESCIEDRQSTTLLKRWEWVAGDKSAKAVALRDRVAGVLTPERMYPHIEAMLDAPLYGMIPVELVWGEEDGFAMIETLRALPTRAVTFDRHRRPVLRHQFFHDTGPIPEGKIVLVRKNHTWENPYGRKLFSALFWPVTFRRGGMKFWYDFMERYGLPRTTATLPSAEYKKRRGEVAQELASMVRDAVAVFEEGTEISTTDVRVSGTSDMYEKFQDCVGAMIARVITGATLQRDAGKTGSYAQAREHGQTGSRRAMMDEVMVENAVNEAVAHIPRFNDPSVPPPLMRYERPDDLRGERATRDVRLSAIGVDFSREYIVRAYGLEDGDVETVAPRAAPGGSEFAQGSPHQVEVDNFVAEQLVGGGRIADAQARRIIRALKNESDPAQVEDILSDIAGEDAQAYADLMGQVMVAAEMYGRESLIGEVGV